MEAWTKIRFMSKKGCSPDNSACEEFFVRLKNDMFYDRSWSGISTQEFVEIIDRYIHWYAEKTGQGISWRYEPVTVQKGSGDGNIGPKNVRIPNQNKCVKNTKFT